MYLKRDYNPKDSTLNDKKPNNITFCGNIIKLSLSTTVTHPKMSTGQLSEKW